MLTIPSESIRQELAELYERRTLLANAIQLLERYARLTGESVKQRQSRTHKRFQRLAS